MKDIMAAINLALEDISNGIPAIEPEAAAFYINKCMVCLVNEGHSSGVAFAHRGYDTKTVDFNISWKTRYTPQIERNHQNEKETTNYGACTLALLLIRATTDLAAIMTANIGTTIDFYLVPKTTAANVLLDDTLIFNNSAYLEVSGIRHETPQNTVEKRVSQKIKRLNVPEDLPTYIAVIEFSSPKSTMVIQS